MFSKIKRKFIVNFKNIPGWTTDRKIVVFISDDWGDQRIRSEEDYQKLLEYGIPVDKSHITRLDTLATYHDLNSLYEVLTSVKDRNGRSAVFTPFAIMANPDFKKIKESDFKAYHYKNFSEMIRSTEEGQETLDAWDKGMSEKLFMPEFHGRDHLNVPLWMDALNSGNEIFRFGFDHNFAHVKIPGMKVSPPVAFYFKSEDDFQFLEHSLKDGAQIFENTFKSKPAVFNPPNGMFHQNFYKTLIESGINTIHTHHFRKQPDKDGNIEKKYFTFGEVSKEGIVHFISNSAFEPAKSEYKGIDETLNQIEAAFRWNKPALINTHRVNYVGGRSIENRDKGLRELEKLLHHIVEKWPEAEFLSAGEFVNDLSKSVLKESS